MNDTSNTDDSVIDVPGIIPETPKASRKPDLVKASPMTVLDELRAQIEKDVRRPDIEIAVPERPGVTVTFSPNIESDLLKQWRKKYTNRKTDELNGFLLSCHIIGATVTGILINGVLAEDDDGIALTFASSEILEMTNTDDAIPDCIQEFYSNDAHIEIIASTILDQAGWTEDIDVEDPTRG